MRPLLYGCIVGDTATAPSCPMSSPSIFGISRFARTPVANTAMPHGCSLPAAVTLSARPSPLTDCTGAFNANLMPSPSRYSCTGAAMSASAMRGTTCPIISTTVTSRPERRRARATSRPITPAPQTTAFSAVFIADSIAMPSAMVLTTKTFSRSLPGIGGTNTLLPAATTRESYSYVLPAVTVFASPSTAVALVPVTTRMPLSLS